MSHTQKCLFMLTWKDAHKRLGADIEGEMVDSLITQSFNGSELEEGKTAHSKCCSKYTKPNRAYLSKRKNQRSNRNQFSDNSFGVDGAGNAFNHCDLIPTKEDATLIFEMMKIYGQEVNIVEIF